MRKPLQPFSPTYDMAATKQLVVVVESTSALGPYWATILSTYLEKIIRSFCGIEDAGPATPVAEMALVNYNFRESYSPCMVERRGWTNNFDVFINWLCAINFNGYLFRDAPIAEGLAEALKMFPPVNGIQNPERHCILVAATNPTPVYNGIGSHLCDAETVAESFPRYLVSLSVICPRKLPKLEAIYNAAKGNGSAINPGVGNEKNPDYLVLIAESFMERLVLL